MERTNKISFDFDSTLDTNAGKKYALELIDRGFDIWIVTTRSSMNITNLHEVIDFADEIGINRKKIIMTNGQDKFKFFWNNDMFLFHLDDDDIEVNEINSNKNLKTKAICFFANLEWKDECERILNDV